MCFSQKGPPIFYWSGHFIKKRKFFSGLQIPSWDSPLLSKREVSLFSVFIRRSWKAKGYSLSIVQSFQVILDLLVL